jgi:hypothetical protein
MKTPDAFKKNLIVCMDEAIEVAENGDAHDLLDFAHHAHARMSETLTYIQQLEQELAAVKRERDAAVDDMKQAQGCICNICKSHYRPDPAVRRYECKILGKFSEIFDNDDGGALFCGKFEWRGVCPENKEAQGDA